MRVCIYRNNDFFQTGLRSSASVSWRQPPRGEQAGSDGSARRAHRRQHRCGRHHGLAQPVRQWYVVVLLCFLAVVEAVSASFVIRRRVRPSQSCLVPIASINHAKTGWSTPWRRLKTIHSSWSHSRSVPINSLYGFSSKRLNLAGGSWEFWNELKIENELTWTELKIWIEYWKLLF